MLSFYVNLYNAHQPCIEFRPFGKKLTAQALSFWLHAREISCCGSVQHLPFRIMSIGLTWDSLLKRSLRLLEIYSDTYSLRLVRLASVRM